MQKKLAWKPVVEKPKQVIPPAQCKLEGCNRDASAKGMCKKHYNNELKRKKRAKEGKPIKVPTSKHIGVYFHSGSKRWNAWVRKDDGKRKHIGGFGTEQEAVAARDSYNQAGTRNV